MRQFRTYLHILGGCDLHSRTVTDSHVAVNYHSKFVSRKHNLPRPKFGHAATLCRGKIIVTSGISDLARNMGMRSVPIADPDCHMFDPYSQQDPWSPLPDVPIGKLHPTLIVVNERFIF